MSTYKVVKYQPEYKLVWDAFVKHSKNATFLFHRDFMEYHQDRFEDYSLLMFKSDKVIAVLPANKVDDNVYSHQGLTYGGLVLGSTIFSENITDMFKELHLYLKANGIKNFVVKTIPNFYFNNFPIDISKIMIDENYEFESSNMVLAVDYNVPLRIHKSKQKKYRNNKHNFRIKQSNSFKSFWEQVLVPRLQEKHNAKPVHTLVEISMLNKRFPNHIKQFDIYLDDEILAGITIFENENVVKSQYGATTAIGEKTRALDYLFLYLINHYKEMGKHFFSMGTVADPNYDLGYNPGLLKQKEELGCTVFEQPILKIEL
ncbi:FemAB family protein [Gaetbulibacter sp. NE]|uniref:FemAB family protein n=1 Tax=unclassified Gaetbulibacter TaxID=2625143 RepID=UPI0021CE1C00|nr:FemAB family protein [Gaetbulibacter sp. NE]